MQPNSLAIIRVLVLLFTAGNVQSVAWPSEHTPDSILVRAIVRIISDEQKEIHAAVHFVYTKQDDILTEVLDGIRNFSTYSIEKIEHISDWRYKRFNIIFIDSYKDFMDFSKKLADDHFHRRGFYIIVVRSPLGIMERVRWSGQIFKAFFDLFYDNVNMLFLDECSAEVSLYTFFPCSATQECYNAVPVLYNTFIGDRFMKRIPHFPNKWTDFNGCPLLVGVYNFPPHIGVTKMSNDLWKVEGIDGKILLGIASRLNFSMKFILSPRRGLLFSNGTATDSMEVLLHGPANLSIGGLFQTEERNFFFSPSRTYLEVDAVFALSVPEEYGSVERIFLPLKLSTWGIHFGLTFAAIIFFTILKKYGSKYRRFIIGDHSRGPFFEMYQTFNGIPLPMIPKYTFARILFAVWLFAGLTLTTVYRSKLFDLLVSRATKRIPETISELKKLEYTLYVPETMFKRVVAFYGPNSRLKSFSTYAREYFKLMQAKGGQRLGVQESKIIVDYFNAHHFRNGVLPVLREKIFTGSIAMYFKKDSYLKYPFNGVLQNFAQSGLIEKWTSDVVNVTSLNILQGRSEPISLAMSHFSGLLKICGIFVGWSLLMFCVELVSMRSNRIRRIILFYTETE